MPDSDDHLVALLLTQRLIETPAKPLKASEYWSVLDLVDGPAQLLGMSPEDVARSLHLDADLSDRIVKLLDASTALAFRLDELEQTGVRAVTSVDEGYPSILVERLGRSAPPVLYVAGDLSLLVGRLLGIVGSRDVDESGAEIAKSAARHAASEGYGVVSGGAKGVDRLAMTAGLDAGGKVVAVLADSLMRATKDSDIRRAIANDELCVCTPYSPNAGFTVANAMGRNPLIYGLSKVTFIVSSDLEKGGTWAGAEQSLRKKIAPVLVWLGEGAGKGNQRLVDKGAYPVHSIDELFELPTRQEPQAKPSRQLALDL